MIDYASEEENDGFEDRSDSGRVELVDAKKASSAAAASKEEDKKA